MISNQLQQTVTLEATMRSTKKERQERGRKIRGVFSVTEAAAALKVPRRKIYRLEAAGKMPPRITVRAIGGKRKLFRRADILAMVDGASVPKPTE